jgi:cell wall-associated NlpC family hydrolase
VTQPTKRWWEYLLDMLLGEQTRHALAEAGAGPEALKGAVTTRVDLGTGYSQADEEARQRGEIVEFARRQIGEPYHFGAEGPADADLDRWDCSELVEHAYVAAGMRMPDGSRQQRDHCHRVHEPKPGDLAYYGPNADGIGHVEIYEGDGLIIGARSRRIGGAQVGKVQRLARMDAEGHTRFEGWYRHPDFARPTEDRA